MNELNGWDREVELQVTYPGADQVMLVGDLDGRPACSLFMEKRGENLWSCRVRVEKGTHWFRYLLSSDSTSETNWHTVLIANQDNTLNVVHLPESPPANAWMARKTAGFDDYQPMLGEQAPSARCDSVQGFSHV